MGKDITLSKLDNIEINYTEAIIDFSDYDSFEVEVENVIAMYSNVDLENYSVEEVKKVKAKLNTLLKRLEDKRIEISKKINEPYVEFKKHYDKPVNRLKSLIELQKKQIDEYEANQKVLRRDKVVKYFEKQASEATLNPKVFEIYYDKFLNATQYKKDTFTFTPKTKKELDAIVLDEINKQNIKDKDYQTIATLCAKENIGTHTYISSYDRGTPLSDVIAFIQRDIDDIIMQKEANRIKQDAERKRIEELERVSQENANAKIVPLNAETGEIFKSDTIILGDDKNAGEAKNIAKNDIPNKDDEIIYGTTLKFRFTKDKAKKFREFLDSEQIEFESVEKMHIL